MGHPFASGHRILPRRGLPTLFQADIDLVPPWPRHRPRSSGGRHRARKCRPASRQRTRRGGLGERDLCDLRLERTRWPDGFRSQRRAIPIPDVDLRPGTGGESFRQPGRATRLDRILRPYVGTLCHGRLVPGLLRRPSRPLRPGRPTAGGVRDVSGHRDGSDGIVDRRWPTVGAERTSRSSCSPSREPALSA